MTAVKAADADAVLRRLDPRVVLVLVYGPDAGLVAERARAVAEGAADDPNDPFQLVKLDGDAVAADPARLADEAGTVALFGGRRIVWVRATTKNLAPAAEALLGAVTGDSLVVLEAGDLTKTAPLRTLCERSGRALAVPCFMDRGEAVAAVVDETLRKAGLRIDKAARVALIDRLGGDRLATRGEVEKLLLYAHGQAEVTLEDVEAALSDVSGLALDNIVDAAFAGDLAAADQCYRRILREGMHPSAVLGGMLRHAFALLPLAASVAEGAAPATALQAWPRLHFARRRLVEAQLRHWKPQALQHIVARMNAAVLETRRIAELAEPIASRALVEVALAARSHASAGR